MSSDPDSSQEKLDRLYAEKKITQDEYDRLRRSLEMDQGQLRAPGLRIRQEAAVASVGQIGVLVVTGIIQIPLSIAKTPLVALTHPDRQCCSDIWPLPKTPLGIYCLSSLLSRILYCRVQESRCRW